MKHATLKIPSKGIAKKSDKFYAVKFVGPDMRAVASEARGFLWPASGTVTAPDWRDDDQCGGGLHACAYGVGDYCLETPPGAKWLVVQVVGPWRRLDDKIKCKQVQVLHVFDSCGAAMLWCAQRCPQWRGKRRASSSGALRPGVVQRALRRRHCYGSQFARAWRAGQSDCRTGVRQGRAAGRLASRRR
jgi:hypothetical protein